MSEGKAEPTPAKNGNNSNEKNGNNGNGNGELRDLPSWFRCLWYVFSRAGLAATMVIIGIVGAGFWFYNVAIPNAKSYQEAQSKISEAQTEFLKQAALNQTRVATLMDKIVATEQIQAEWQINWKHEIEEQHSKRQAEAKAIQDKLDEQTKVHQAQIAALDTISKARLDEAKDLQSRMDEVSKVHTEQIKLLQRMIEREEAKPKPGAGGT